MPFPRDRYTAAGANETQLSALEAEYDALSALAQSSYDARLAPLSNYEIAAELPSEAPVEEDVEDEVPEPVAAQPSTAGSGVNLTFAGGSSSGDKSGGSSSGD